MIIAKKTEHTACKPLHFNNASAMTRFRNAATLSCVVVLSIFLSTFHPVFGFGLRSDACTHKIYNVNDHDLSITRNKRRQWHSNLAQGMIGTGFSFEDDERQQILVSVQKPLGIVLEQDDEGEEYPIVVAQVDPTGSAGRAGVKQGDVLVAVQNASVEKVDLDSVLTFIQNDPRVINLRLQRR